ncbi:MAG: hypothetical protein A2511_11390 [Deltaproteobacteria bacterium RIFOXYD12_FULL_50_9]|nr:MAG: hypothetical protein A2511_11390 [Deltaproteobacteria bacterium RIFOXYD12_FULL_50_9]
MIGMEVDQRQQLRKYIDLVLRRKKIIITAFLCAFVSGVGVYLRTPKVYLSSSLIMFQQQQINPSKMSPDVAAIKTTEIVNTVGQQVTSRTNLEEVIKRYKLYPDLVEELPMEDVVTLMRENHIAIKPQKGDVFMVTYEGQDPKKVMLVANALASKFIEENLRFREEKTSETSAYVKDELKLAKDALDKKESVMRDYKLQYYNEMAQQLPVNMERLNALQGQYQSTQTNVQNLEHTRLLVQEQISLKKDMLNQLAERKVLETEKKQAEAAVTLSQKNASLSAKDDKKNPGQEMADIKALRLNLEAMQAKYTDQHPDVKRLRRMLAKLEEEAKAAASKADSGAAGGDKPADRQDNKSAASSSPEQQVAGGYDQQLEQLQRQLKDVGFNISRLNNEMLEIQKQIKTYQKWVDSAPVREAEWTALTRDYNELRKHYETLVSRNLEADSAETLERHQKGSQFKIVDSAHIAEKPIKPDFRKIMLVAIALGLGVGFGISLGIEILDTSFKDAGDVEQALGLTVLCAIPVLENEQDIKRQKRRSLLWTLALVVAVLIICVGMAYLIRRGSIVI